MVLKCLGGVLLQLGIFAGLLLAPVGAWTWWRAWVFIGMMAAAGLAAMIGIVPLDPGLLNERFKPPIQRGQPLADKIILIAFLAAFFGVMAFIPLDVFRLHLLGRPGPAVSALGLAFVVASVVLMYLALRENTFASLVVRHQAERRQTVIDTGVYSAVRHPMYAGGILLLAGAPLWLESYAALIAASIPTALLIARIHIEERFLRRELAGYDAYTRRTRYKLIPFVW